MSQVLIRLLGPREQVNVDRRTNDTVDGERPTSDDCNVDPRRIELIENSPELNSKIHSGSRTNDYAQMKDYQLIPFSVGPNSPVISTT